MDVVLDSGGLTAWAEHRPPPALLRLLAEVARTGGIMIVPTVTLVEATTGLQRDDALLNWRLRAADLDDCTPERARDAAVLRHRSNRDTSAVDAVVAATAMASPLAAVVTSDPQDLTSLLAEANHPVPVLGV